MRTLLESRWKIQSVSLLSLTHTRPHAQTQARPIERPGPLRASAETKNSNFGGGHSSSRTPNLAQFLKFARIIMSTQPLYEEYTGGDSPSSEIDLECVSAESEAKKFKYASLSTVAYYPSKGPNHVAEHVYELNDNFNRRREHWKECVLDANCKDPDLPDALAKAELKDCLSTIWLQDADKDWGTERYFEALKALKDGISTQVQVPDFMWERQQQDAADHAFLDEGLANSPELAQLYQVDAYVEHAVKRLRAVNFVLSKIGAENLRGLHDNSLYKLLKKHLTSICPDPREALLDKVAMFHWYIRTDFDSLTLLPMI